MKKTIVMGLMGLAVVFGTKAACNLANGTVLTVSITAPTNDEKLVMEGTGENLKKSDSSELTAFTASPSNGTDDNLCWTFNGFDFSEGATDVSVVVHTPATWSDNNSFWGPKPISLKYKDGIEGATGDCEDKIKVKLFYDPLVKIANVPAWFKYWQDGALKELTDFTYCDVIDGDENTWGTYEPGIDWWPGSFDCLPAIDELRIASFAHATEVTTPELHIYITGRPLKLVTCVVEHELSHRDRRWTICETVQTMHDIWWDSLSWVERLTYFCDTPLHASVIAGFRDSVDEDHDFVSNLYDPTNRIGSSYDDEVLAEVSMQGLLHDGSEDWSEGGVNWYVQ